MVWNDVAPCERHADTAPVRPKSPVDVLDLFPEERSALLALLTGLPADLWQAQTACAGWSVKDLAAHVLGDDFGELSGSRDRYYTPRSPFSAPLTWDQLVTLVNEQNEGWIQATRRLSPQLLIELLGWTGERLIGHFRSVDLLATGPVVSWAGPGPAPRWLHVAREYTERWMHQQQIREAVGAAGLYERRLFAPVLDIFMYALPLTYKDVVAREGTHVRVVVTGDAGGRWSIVRTRGSWGLYDGVVNTPDATVTLDQDTAWRLFTKGVTPSAAQQSVVLDGDPALGAKLLSTVAIIA